MRDETFLEYRRRLARERRRRARAGVPMTDLVDPARARAHVEDLRRTYDVSYETVGALTGMHGSYVEAVMNPAHNDYPERISRHTEAALLAARFDLDVLPDRSFLSAVGTTRRIRALARMGWTLQHIGERMGVTRASVAASTSGRRVTARTARTIRDIYDDLWDVPGPSATTIRRATRAGWPPPLAWDDDTIDRVDGEPATGRDLRTGGGVPNADRIEEIEWLFAYGDPGATRADVARRFGISVDGLDMVLRRAERPDIVERFRRNEAQAEDGAA